MLLLLRVLPKADGLRLTAGSEEAVSTGVDVGVEEEFMLSCMFLIRLLIRDGGRGFFSGFTWGGRAGAGPPPEEDAADTAASAEERVS